MSDENEDSGEKSHDPTEQRLEDARKKGDVAKSVDLLAASAYLGFLLSLFIAGSSAVTHSGELMMSFLSRADTLAPRVLSMGGGLLTGQITLGLFGALAPLFALPALFVILALIGQQAFVVAPEKLVPKLDRISPLSQAKSKFGPTGLFEFAKSATKLMVISVLVGSFLLSRTDQIVGLTKGTPVDVGRELADISIALLIQIAVVAFAIGAIDYLWQRHDHMRKLRMTFQELRDEHKRSEGDPFVKGQRRRRAEDIVNNKMMQDVPTASVIIVNPTHYAVALKWDRATGGAPVVVAKGVDNVALRIREVAGDARVPIHSDPPTARALEAGTEIGMEIDPAHYQAVAAAIRFAEAMRRRAKDRGI